MYLLSIERTPTGDDEMTQAEAISLSHTKPVGFVKGSNGIEGFYGRVYFKGQVHKVNKFGEWNYETATQASAATKRFCRILADQQARRPAA
jgi:hypothetical protein